MSIIFVFGKEIIVIHDDPCRYFENLKMFWIRGSFSSRASGLVSLDPIPSKHSFRPLEVEQLGRNTS